MNITRIITTATATLAIAGAAFTGMATAEASAATLTLKPAFTPGATTELIPRHGYMDSVVQTMRIVGGPRGGTRLGFLYVMPLQRWHERPVQKGCFGTRTPVPPKGEVPGNPCWVMLSQNRGVMKLRNNSSYRIRVSYR